MAYTIISQNNTTTTLADENGNVIHVPAKTVLATSTSYTITKVNNNSADLEDENGKVIRGVPCVVVLAGDGGGGGGTIDRNTVINKAKSLPTATANNVNQVYMYDGITNANYTKGYVYQNIKTATYTGTVSFVAATISGTTVTCSGDNFANFLTESGVEPLSVVSGTMTYDIASELWVLVGKDSDGNTVLTFQEYQQDFVDAGFTFTGTPQDGDVVAFTCAITEASASYAWTRIDVQPAGGSTYTAGTGISIDANNEISVTTPVLINRALNKAQYAIGIRNSDSTTQEGISSIGIGAYQMLGPRSIAIGGNTRASGTECIAIGDFAQCEIYANYCIQLGTPASACPANTFQVWNYPLLDKTTGLIPAARLVNASTTTTATLTSAGWSSNTQTVSVTGLTATQTVFVAPAPVSTSDYVSAGILCTGQAAGQLTFTCDSVPSSDITVNLVIMGA